MSTPDIRAQLTSGLTLAAVPGAAGVARSFVRQRLSQWGLNRLINDAELVLSELVSNAVNATGTTGLRPRWSDLRSRELITVRLVVTADCLVIEVRDSDPNPPAPKQPQQEDEAGRGLLIVAALSRRWHFFFPESGGKAIWAELVIPACDSLPSELPKRQQPRRALERWIENMPTYVTLERVLEGLRNW